MMEYKEDDYLLLSGIQHFNFCRRQWALIHIEQQWEENVRTVEGNYLHTRADQPMIREKRGNKLIVRALPIHSKELGITGICDVVEFIQDPNGVVLAGEEGLYLPFPVEYKRGKPKKDDSDISQLTAQAICLEEMLVCDIERGYIFYDEIKHRVEVSITLDYRQKVKKSFEDMHHHFQNNYTPKVKTGPHCENCSLQHICLPDMLNKKSVSSYISGRLRE
ncbi:CRISPR-associated protein Cas4 [Sulfoacidibacillus ferrooxidans]|nr:CRISPR-associated protein Cas4 [Sulfoacidibacillus ferrooxidans]